MTMTPHQAFEYAGPIWADLPNVLHDAGILDEAQHEQLVGAIGRRIVMEMGDFDRMCQSVVERRNARPWWQRMWGF